MEFHAIKKARVITDAGHYNDPGDYVPDKITSLRLKDRHLVVETSSGTEYRICETPDGNLVIWGGDTLFTRSDPTNVVEIMSVPYFVPHVIEERP
jgi:hypothetical protein